MVVFTTRLTLPDVDLEVKKQHALRGATRSQPRCIPGGRSSRGRAGGLPVRYDDRVISRQTHLRHCRHQRDLGVERIVRKACVGPPTSVPCGDTMRTCGYAEEPWGARGLRIAAIGVAALLGLIPWGPVSGAEGTRRIMVLYPVSDGQPGIILFDQGLRSDLQVLICTARSKSTTNTWTRHASPTIVTSGSSRSSSARSMPAGRSMSSFPRSLLRSISC